MPSFTTSSSAPAAPEAVMRFILDLDNWSMFPGYGPVPAIRKAELVGDRFEVGARIRVTNSDGSVHHERVAVLEPLRYVVEMELDPPASWVMATIRETVDLSAAPEGTRIERTFDVEPRSVVTAPFVALVARWLERGIRRHNEAVAAAFAANSGAPHPIV